MTAGNVDNLHDPSTFPGVKQGSVGPRVLIAEEHPAIEDLLCSILQLAGYRPMMCAGRQTILTWREQTLVLGDDPMVLLIDLSLLGVTEATDFLHLLRARWREAGGVPPTVIVLTTSKQLQVALGTMERVLQKPFHVRELLALIRQVIPPTS